MIRRPTSAVHNGGSTIKTKCGTIAKWDFSLRFALLSPLIGAALGLFGVFLRYR